VLAKGQTVIQLFEQLAPKHYALPDDKIGLQLGTLNKAVEHVLVALDVTDEVVEEAVRVKADLIIAHHAIIYRPLKHIQTDTPAGKLYEKLIKHDVAVYIAHTNLDVADGGVNDMMADALGLTGLSHLDDIHTDKLKKLVVFVPEAEHQKVRNAVFAAGAGDIGQYSHCSFNISGTGTFLPEAGAKPFIGKPGQFESVAEVRLETVVSESIERRVIQAMLKAHPYEEVAYDLYPMDLKGRTFGLGRVGKLLEACSVAELVKRVKLAFDVPTVRVVGALERQVKKIAVLGGSGGRYINHAIYAGADVLITGDIDYHSAQDALAAGLCIIDPGHNAEKIMKSHVAAYLTKQLSEKKYQTKVTASTVNTEVFIFI
jgi:dinuclear metal center YbgI/SA1388 family protein